jgi:hypothetical protein
LNGGDKALLFDAVGPVAGGELGVGAAGVLLDASGGRRVADLHVVRERGEGGTFHVSIMRGDQRSDGFLPGCDR